MKKVISISFLFLLQFSFSFGQEEETEIIVNEEATTSSIYLGVRSGMLMSTVTGRAEPQAIAIGGSTGLVFQYRFSERFGIVTELLFDTKGYVSRTEIGGNKAKEKSRLQYIDIPVTVRTYFGKHEANKGFFGLGPYVGIGLFEKYVKIEYELFDKQKTLIRNPFTDQYNRIDAGLDVELGYIVVLREDRSLEFNFQQSIGLTKLSEVTILGNIKNLYQTFTIAYLFGLN